MAKRKRRVGRGQPSSAGVKVLGIDPQPVIVGFGSALPDSGLLEDGFIDGLNKQFPADPNVDYNDIDFIDIPEGDLPQSKEVYSEQPDGYEGSIGPQTALGIVQGVGAIMAGIGAAKDAKLANEFAQQQSEFQQEITKLKIEHVNRRTRQQIEEGRLDSQRIRGKGRVASAVGGTLVDSGSRAAIQESNAQMTADDEIRLKNNARNEIFGLEAEAIAVRGQAEQNAIATRNRARSSVVTGGLSAVSSIAEGLNRDSGNRNKDKFEFRGGEFGKGFTYNDTSKPDSFTSTKIDPAAGPKSATKVTTKKKKKSLRIPFRGSGFKGGL